ncbi:uncharacterized protein LOC119684163 [Teleopsis dalmanni]|uniref:uncharacterized protein LOC119684163 n=1 Tax=Teleopsis dalmanni TaxID=139649 RepID=UPI0018CED996|nr:uncharacterized protein LOC119684163 [Teleopsis dalmanni]
MERSQSYTHFELSEDDNNINNNNVINSKLSTITLSKTKNVRRTRKLQKQQQIQQAISGSSDNIDAVTISNTLQLKRKRQLQRQKTAELDDDMEYAAEEEYEDDEYEVNEICENVLDFESTLTQILPKNITTNERTKRQLPYQKSHLSQDDSLSTTITTDSPSSPTSPTNKSHQFKHADSFDSNSTGADMSPISRRHNFVFLPRDNSIHSDSSHYSSVDSLLEARKPDPEAILINLGFGPVGSEDILSRIPKRFLKPSQVRGIDTDAFVKRLQLASNLADHSVLGYRGLTGNPDIPPSTIVAKIMQRFEVNERKRSMGSIEHAI